MDPRAGVRRYHTDPAFRERGFTLLEILVVLTILAILTGTVMLGFTGAGRDQTLKGGAERLAQRIELARQRALTRNREWGLYVDETGYAFAELEPREGIWIRQSGRPFGGIDLPERVRLSLEVEDFEQPASDEDENLPEVVIFSSGEITPFRLVIEPEEGGSAWQITSDGLAPARAERVESS